MAEQVPSPSPDITSDDKLWSALGYPIALIAEPTAERIPHRFLVIDNQNASILRFHDLTS